VGAIPAVAIVVVLFTGAMVGAAWTSLHPGAIVGGSLGAGAWREVLADPAFRRALAFTLWLAVASTALAVPAALALAVAVRRSSLARLGVAAPVPVPHLVVAALAVLWLGPGGLADRLLGGLPVELVGDRAGVGIILTYLYKEAPFLALIVLAAWDRATDDLLEAAAAFGAGPVRRTLDVLVPRVAPALALGAAVVAAFVVGATEVPLLVGSSGRDTLATHSLDLTRLGGPAARAQAAAVLLVAGALAAALVVPVALLARRFRP
jgi:putative spermidine/putrescine transport system permease protein